MTRLIFAPPLPLNAFQGKTISIKVRRLSIEELRHLVEQYKQHGVEIVNFIRHPSTVKLLNQLLGLNMQPSSELYQYQQGDIIIVVGLRRPVRGQEVEVKPEDLDVAIVEKVEVGS
ncbi:MAG: hypothetical protein DRJ38_03590 [Thermoprotei archaeon]|nr:MAG: hypothetical protein DRJ38_03590 [Thermoprotei archaeon]